jgi:hypothetical protein
MGFKDALDSLSGETSKIAGKIDSIPQDIQTLKDTVLRNAQPSSDPGTKEELADMWTPKRIASCLGTSSFYGIASMKAIHDAAAAGKYSDLKVVVGERSADYAFGYLLGIESTGMFELERKSKEERQTLRVVHVRDDVRNAVNAEWEVRREAKADAVREIDEKIERSLVA